MGRHTVHRERRFRPQAPTGAVPAKRLVRDRPAAAGPPARTEAQEGWSGTAAATSPAASDPTMIRRMGPVWNSRPGPGGSGGV
jgi:hypothetical protein